MKTVKIAEIYREKIHTPRHKQTGTVFYVPKTSSDSNIQQDRAFLTKTELMANKDKFMNSPTNIRRVWFTVDKVAVEYFSGPLANGQQGKLLKVSDISGVRQKAEEMLKYRSMTPSQRTFSKNTIDAVKFDGRLSQAITYPWTCNNIEEIYFDYSILLSEESEIIINSLGINYNQLLLSLMQGQPMQVKADNNLCAKLFVGLNSNEIGRSYKRLRTIAFISGLSTIVKWDKFEDTVTKFTVDKLELKPKSWIQTQAVKSLIQQTNSLVWVSDLSSKALDNKSVDNFTIKSSQYEFDDRYLRTKIKTYVDKLTDSLINQTSYTAQKEKKEADASAEVVEQGSVEELLQSIEKQYGKDFVTSVLRTTATELKDRDQSSIVSVVLSVMSTSKKEYYKKMLSGK